MLCRRGEYLLFPLRALERLAGLQQDFAAVRLARRLARLCFHPHGQRAGDARGNEHHKKRDRIPAHIIELKCKARHGKQIIENQHACNSRRNAVHPSVCGQRRTQHGEQIYRNDICLGDARFVKKQPDEGGRAQNARRPAHIPPGKRQRPLHTQASCFLFCTAPSEHPGPLSSASRPGPARRLRSISL